MFTKLAPTTIMNVDAHADEAGMKNLENSFDDTQAIAQGIACDGELQGAKNVETYWIDEAQDDPNMTRAWVAIKECPQPDVCSKKAWDRASVFSFQNHKQCLGYALQHLQNSSLHTLGKDAAQALLATEKLKWSYGIDCFQDRQTYRDQQASIHAQQSAKQAQADNQVEPVAGQKRKRRSDALENRCSANVALAANIAMLLYEEDDLVAAIHNRQAKQLADGTIDLNPDVTVSSDQIKHIRDNLIRANECLKTCKVRCLEFSQMIHREQLVIKDALVAVELMSRGGLSSSSTS